MSNFTHFKNFTQLTQRAGNYLISRTPDNPEEFAWENLRGKTVIGGRLGGMPQMILEYILTENGLISGVDVEIITNLQFASTAGAFIAGIGDYTMEFDPSALAIEQTGQGFVVRGLGTDSGIVPYTVYMANKSFIAENPDIIQRFTNAIYRGQQWFFENSSRAVAELIHPHFEEHSIDDLEIMIERYREMDVFSHNPILSQDGFERLQDIMDLSGELSQRVEFTTLIDNYFAETAVRN
ncbi:MAG: ABC transporter substrate-binding protein [Defluviitaleaceae bacterium]|nr:ABC transporter substrate-binding protein [Defluviitaleaceae bacterium]